MQRILIVHIGTHKTGSTSIQRMLAVLVGSLLEAGIHVPAAAREAGGHANLVAEYSHPARPYYDPGRGGWTALLDELTRSTAPRFVVSAEAFTGPHNGREGAARVAALARAADLDVQVVGYVRPQYQRLESGYVQRVKMGNESAPFETILKHHADDPRLDYGSVFRPWREAFGDRLKIRPLDPARMPHGLLADFLTVIGADGLRVPSGSSRMNRRLGAKHLEVLRLTGIALAARAVAQPDKGRMLAPLRSGLPALLDEDRPFAGLSPKQVQAVTERFAAPNVRFAREYGIDAGGVLFRAMPEDGVRARPNSAAWGDLSGPERTRVQRFVHDTVGVDIANTL